MTKMFGSMSNDGLEQAEDRIGGFSVFESKIYSGTIKAMYAGKSDGGAQNMTIIADLGGREYRETIYFTSRDGKNYYHPKDKQGKLITDKKMPLPGFTIVNDICLVATGEPLENQDVEEKVFKIYDYEAKAEVPTNVPMITAAIGQPVSFAIQKVLENKSKKNDAGGYDTVADTRELNTIQKVFDTESKKTVVEAINGQDAGFWDAWSEKNDGKLYDKRTIRDGGDAGNAGRPAANGNSGAPAAGAKSATKSLFGKAA